MTKKVACRTSFLSQGHGLESQLVCIPFLINLQEWEIIEKVLEDGTKKRYRRRIITTTTTKPTYVIRKGTEEMGHVMEDKPIEGSPEPEPVEDIKRESPEVVPAENESHEHHQEVTTT